jgi:hypothetical protein
VIPSIRILSTTTKGCNCTPLWHFRRQDKSCLPIQTGPLFRNALFVHFLLPPRGASLAILSTGPDESPFAPLSQLFFSPCVPSFFKIVFIPCFRFERNISQPTSQKPKKNITTFPCCQKAEIFTEIVIVRSEAYQPLTSPILTPSREVDAVTICTPHGWQNKTFFVVDMEKA